jgi:hypothetical protein
MRNNSTLISKALFTLAFMFIFQYTIFAQNGKNHFVINNPDKPAETQIYYDALREFDFASYRFYDKRRIIKFVNSNVTLELYSAKELLDTYQKPINPSTLMDNVPKKDIAFLMTGGKIQVVSLKK